MPALGRSFGLVTINPVFIPWHRDQIVRLGLTQRNWSDIRRLIDRSRLHADVKAQLGER